MRTVCPLWRRATFSVPQSDLMDDELCAELKMATLSVTAKRAAKIKTAAHSAGIRIGSRRLCLPFNPCGNCGCQRCRRMFQEAFVMAYAPFLYEDAWRELLPKLKGAKRPMAITLVPRFGKVPVGGDIDLDGFKGRCCRTRAEAEPSPFPFEVRRRA